MYSAPAAFSHSVTLIFSFLIIIIIISHILLLLQVTASSYMSADSDAPGREIFQYYKLLLCVFATSLLFLTEFHELCIWTVSLLYKFNIILVNFDKYYFVFDCCMLLFIVSGLGWEHRKNIGTCSRSYSCNGRSCCWIFTCHHTGYCRRASHRLQNVNIGFCHHCRFYLTGQCFKLLRLRVLDIWNVLYFLSSSVLLSPSNSINYWRYCWLLISPVKFWIADCC